MQKKDKCSSVLHFCSPLFLLLLINNTKNMVLLGVFNWTTPTFLIIFGCFLHESLKNNKTFQQFSLFILILTRLFNFNFCKMNVCVFQVQKCTYLFALSFPLSLSFSHPPLFLLFPRGYWAHLCPWTRFCRITFCASQISCRNHVSLCSMFGSFLSLSLSLSLHFISQKFYLSICTFQTSSMTVNGGHIYSLHF